MTILQIKSVLLLIILAVLITTGCNARTPATQASKYIPDFDKQIDPLLLHEVQSLNVPSADATFQITNPTYDSCSFTFGGVSCGCTSAEIDGKPLQFKDRFTLIAGGSARFKLTSRLPVKPGLSGFRANLTAISANDTRSDMSVHYSVKILADIVLTPDVLSHEFRSLDEGAVTRDIRVERRWRGSSVPSSLPILGHLPPHLRILQIIEDKPPDQIEPGIWSRSWKINVSLAPSSDLQSNPIRRLIPITFPAVPGFDPLGADLPVLVRLASGIEAPELVHFGSVQLGVKQTRRIVMRAADNVEFSVLNVHSTSPAFSASKPSSTHCRTCWLELTFKPNEPGNHRANIVIETNHPKSQRVLVEVRGTGSGTSDRNARTGERKVWENPRVGRTAHP